jgi:hypothetical protein
MEKRQPGLQQVQEMQQLKAQQGLQVPQIQQVQLAVVRKIQVPLKERIRQVKILQSAKKSLA